MTSLSISVPEQMREWVESQVKAGKYGNVSEYVRDLIRQDQKREAQEHLEKLLLEGVNSPKSPMTKKDWADIRGKLARRLSESKEEGGRQTRRKK